MNNDFDIHDFLESAVRDRFLGELQIKQVKESGDPDVAFKFLQEYSRGDEQRRAKIVEIVGKIGDERVSGQLAEYLDGESSPIVRAGLVKVLGDFGKIELIPVLARYLNDADTRVRANTVEGLSHIYDSRVPDLLLPLLDDDDNRVRANTAIALWKYDELKLIVCETFEKMLKDSSKWMRASAYYAFGEVDLEDFVLQLTQALGREDEDVCHAVVVALIGYAEKNT